MQYLGLVLALATLARAYTVVVATKFMDKNIDPVVYPGQYDKSHMHSFFGSDAININTKTSKELQAGCSTAENPNDFSSYWFPTPIVTQKDGKKVPVPISRFSAYYVDINSAEVPIPQDYQHAVGNAKAVTQADVDPLSGFSWFCEGPDGYAGGDPGPKDGADWPKRTCKTHMQVLLLFHDCVNEQTLASTYSGTQNWNSTFKAPNRCPEGMKRMPRLRFSIRFDLRKVLPDGWEGTPPLELPCGSPYCFHGDFINGWTEDAAQNMLAAKDKNEFAGVDGKLGAYNAGTICKDKPTDADPSHGTSDYLTSVGILEGAQKTMVRRRRGVVQV